MTQCPAQLRWTSWGLRALVLVAAGTALAAAPAPHGGVRFEAAQANARAIALLDESGTRQLPFGGFSLRQPGRADWLSITLYVMYREVSDGDSRRRESYWVARRLDGTDSPKASSAPEVRWTASATCAELDATVRTMGEVVEDRLELALPGADDVSETPASSVRYGYWSEQARFRGTGTAASLHVAAAEGSPLAAWVDARLAALAACWADAPPAGATVASQ